MRLPAAPTQPSITAQSSGKKLSAVTTTVLVISLVANCRSGTPGGASNGEASGASGTSGAGASRGSVVTSPGGSASRVAAGLPQPARTAPRTSIDAASRRDTPGSYARTSRITTSTCAVSGITSSGQASLAR